MCACFMFTITSLNKIYFSVTLEFTIEGLIRSLVCQVQVLMGSHSFIFDHVYGGGGSPSDKMFEECAVPLLDALFQGYNGTVIAYGQVILFEQTFW